MWLNIDSAKCLFSLAFSKLFSNRMFLLLLLLLLVECLIHNSCKWFGAADFNWHVLSNKQSSLHAWLAWNVNRFGDNQFQESNCELVGWAPEWIPRTTRNKWKKTERRCRNRIKGRPFFFWFLMIYLLFCRNILESLDVQEIDVRESERAREWASESASVCFLYDGRKKGVFLSWPKNHQIFCMCADVRQANTRCKHKLISLSTTKWKNVRVNFMWGGTCCLCKTFTSESFINEVEKTSNWTEHTNDDICSPLRAVDL